MTPPYEMIRAAIEAARRSPCAKSKRGVAVYVRACRDLIATGFNGQPSGACDGACRDVCSKVCVHAETRALRRTLMWLMSSSVPMLDLDAVHVKLGADGLEVPGGGPSCWQCSREVLDVGLGGFWLYETTVAAPTPTWRRYTAAEFHAETLRTCGLVQP